ncbi:leucine-rich repeat-containing protein 43-like isoform X2 [Mastacembelus armatus]|uniref:leucine-rich repeat-containing protein 43-like isoform X2 n=1 Tax=Mastacembelus armatus TaxID=205130 RepID=UPI000E4642D5|nr:leucine-rich repeat-containing protein 43 isoform X2 [Mastacembelus armatus]
MSSNTLSAVLEKQIRRLCLNDFPCGNGSWRKSKDSAEGPGTEETDALLDLLSCPHSPWGHEESWSPQAAALRQLAVLTPERLHADFIYKYFTTFHIVDKDVSIIDDGLLKFSKLEELVLTANKISEIPVKNLPNTLKILELRANRLSALSSLTNHPPPRLQYLGLGFNSLGSHDIAHLTGRHWPHLVCLDLSDCEFQDQPALLNSLSTLPCLKTLMLQGNPFTLVSSFPGFTVDSLPQLCFLDALLISSEERRRFRGLAEMSDLIANRASVTVSVGTMRGIPNPLMSVDQNAPGFPVVTYSYFITYKFLKVDNEPEVDTAARAHATEDSCSDADVRSNNNCERQMSKPDTEAWMVGTEETCHVSRHTTSKLPWSECMDFSDTQTYIVSDVGGLKKFFNQGFCLTLEEEKVLSWPAASEEIPVAKPSQTTKEKKGGNEKECPIKSGSTKDKKKKSVPELVQDAPIKRILGSVHVPLQSLLRGSQKVDTLCDFGALHQESEMEAAQTLEKDLGKKIKEDKKKEDKESKWRGGNSTQQKNTTSSKYRGKQEHKADVHKDNSVCIHPDPVTVELSVELEKWRSVSEAHQVS